MQQFFARRWFLIVLVAVLTIGFTCYEALAEPAKQAPRDLIVAAVLFFMSLPLDARAMWRALRYPWPALLAATVNMVAVPLLAWLASPFLAPDLATGLIIMAVIPCTLASSAVWTRRAGGNDAVALMVTMATNLACFLITPAWLRLLTKAEATLDYNHMMKELLLFVVLPILIAQLCRLHLPLANWATRYKTPLSILSQCGILGIVLLGSIDGGAKLASGESGKLAWSDWALMLIAVNFVHITALWLGHLLAGLCRMKRDDRIAVGFAGSQKTLAIGLALGPEYFSGLTIMPMIAYHVCQLLFDTLVVDYLRDRERKSQQALAAADESKPAA